MAQVTDWLSHLSEPEAAALLTLAARTAGPLAATEARAAHFSGRGYSLGFVQPVIRARSAGRVSPDGTG